VSDDSTFMFPTLVTPRAWLDHSASGLNFQSFANMQVYGGGLMGMGGGADSLGFDFSSAHCPPPPVFPAKSLSPNMTATGIDEAGFGWGGQQQLFNDFPISDDPFEHLHDFVPRFRTPDENIRDLSASELCFPE